MRNLGRNDATVGAATASAPEILSQGDEERQAGTDIAVKTAER
jgi:hypothetical protein